MTAKAGTKAKRSSAKAAKAPERARPKAKPAKTSARSRPSTGKVAKPSRATRSNARSAASARTTQPKAPVAKPKAPAARTKTPVAKPKSGVAKAKSGAASTARRSTRRDGTTFALDKLGQVALTARDLDAAVVFYRDVLQLRLLARFDPPGLAFFHLGPGLRLLVSATASAASLYFTVDNLTIAVRELKKRGVEFLQKPTMIHRDDAGEFGKKGVEEWMAFFNDPSGNLLALVERR